ncbi:hypothetical protein PybrP1_002609 [[Pythium] brassicae (nom. inval.)]|nr:hypothetical protein PybrP1_002609 [[Pythium] brassicae (nom. inval.)]
MLRTDDAPSHYHRHTHELSAEVMATYLVSAAIKGEEVLSKLDAMVDANAPTQRTAAAMSREIRIGLSFCVDVASTIWSGSSDRELFACYDEYLLLDFTFNIDNLVFYLGSFVVTSPTGRGIPITDFLCLNRRTDTLTAVIEFTKSVNSAWKAVEVFVLDNGFNEWRVLEETFPEAKVSYDRVWLMSKSR